MALIFSSLYMCPVYAVEDGTHEVTPFLRDSRLTLQLRSHFLERGQSSAADSLGWAGGGWLEYRSGWAFDTVQLGLTGYTSQKLYAPADKDGASVLASGQQPYSVFGEAFAALKYSEHQLTGGRFLINQHEVNPQDTRMSPRTFQGIALSGRIGALDYFGGLIGKMKTRNSAEFIDVATVAGAPLAVNEPLLLLSGHVVPQENLNFGFSGYQMKDLLASAYVDASVTLPLVSGDTLRLGGQYMRQRSTGANLLTGAAFSTAAAGIKLDWLHGPLTLSAILMQTDPAAAYRTPFGSWQGYACRIITSFNRAGERVRAVDAVLDLGRVGMAGLAINGSVSFGRGAINTATGLPLPDNAEYDLTADYRLSGARWPAWARSLWLRARTARLEQRLDAGDSSTTEQHLIVNYTVALK